MTSHFMRVSQERKVGAGAALLDGSLYLEFWQSNPVCQARTTFVRKLDYFGKPMNIWDLAIWLGGFYAIEVCWTTSSALYTQQLMVVQ